MRELTLVKIGGNLIDDASKLAACLEAFSKIKGAKGNIEFWIYLKNSKTLTKSDLNYDKIIQGAVNAAHLFFTKEQ